MEKVGLIIGHNKRSQGAYSTIVGNEWSYWRDVASKIKGAIPEFIDVYERQPNMYYTREMFEVIEKLNSQDYKFCLELHFNSSTNINAEGCECLVYYKSNKGKALAIDFMARLQQTFGSKIRGNRGLIEVKDSKERGAYGICKSKDTYILLEPFFGSNLDESLKFSIISDVVALFVKFIKDNI